MKKTIWPVHFGYVLTLLLLLAFLGAGVFTTIYSINEIFANKNWDFVIYFICGVLTICLFLELIAYCLHNRVILTDEKIIITGHWDLKNSVVQHRDEISYSEIKGVAIICANANSKKKPNKGGISPLRPFFYFEFTLVNEKTKWMYIECYSKRQRIKILETINSKTGLNLSYKQLERKDFSIYRKRKK